MDDLVLALQPPVNEEARGPAGDGVELFPRLLMHYQVGRAGFILDGDKRNTLGRAGPLARPTSGCLRSGLPDSKDAACDPSNSRDVANAFNRRGPSGNPERKHPAIGRVATVARG